MIQSFCLFCSFLPLKRYLFVEDRLDWNPTSKMEKMLHAISSLRHLGRSWVPRRRSLSNTARPSSSRALTRATAWSVEKPSVTMRSMWSTRFTGRRWIKTNTVDISKDLSKIFKLTNRVGGNVPVPVTKKRRILRTPSNSDRRRLSWKNQNSALFQSLKFILSWRRHTTDPVGWACGPQRMARKWQRWTSSDRSKLIFLNLFIYFPFLFHLTLLPIWPFWAFCSFYWDLLSEIRCKIWFVEDIW